MSDRITIGIIGCGRQGGKTLAQSIMDEVVTEEKELTWEGIYHDFHEHCPNVASLVDDYRPYAQNMIQIWTKTHVTLTYNYLTKEMQCL